MPFRHCQTAQRFADHHSGIGYDGIQAAEAMNKRLDGVRRGFLIAYVTVDEENTTLSRKDAAQSAVRQVDNSSLPPRHEQMTCDGPANAPCPSGDQGDGFRHIQVRQSVVFD